MIFGYPALNQRLDAFEPPRGHLQVSARFGQELLEVVGRLRLGRLSFHPLGLEHEPCQARWNGGNLGRLPARYRDQPRPTVAPPSSWGNGSVRGMDAG
jgi:hypothetical protein